MEIIMRGLAILGTALVILPFASTTCGLVSPKAHLKGTEYGVILGCTQGTLTQRRMVPYALLKADRLKDTPTGGRYGCDLDHTLYCTVDMIGEKFIAKHRDKARKLSGHQEAALKQALPDVEAKLPEDNIFEAFEDNSIPFVLSELVSYSAMALTPEILQTIYRKLKPWGLLMMRVSFWKSERTGLAKSERTYFEPIGRKIGFTPLRTREAFTGTVGALQLARLVKSDAITQDDADEFVASPARRREKAYYKPKYSEGPMDDPEPAEVVIMRKPKMVAGRVSS
jgi:hypothetical protein